VAMDVAFGTGMLKSDNVSGRWGNPVKGRKMEVINMGAPKPLRLLKCQLLANYTRTAQLLCAVTLVMGNVADAHPSNHRQRLSNSDIAPGEEGILGIKATK
jgi:hypothetical protein